MRTLTVKEVVKFYKEFPFMETIVDRESAQDPEHLKLKVQVSVADAESLYIIPRFCLSPHWVGNSDGKFVGRFRPIAHAFDNEGVLLNILTWDYEHPCPFLKEVITDKNTKTVVLAIKYMWWHEIEDWVSKGLDTFMGKYSHREYVVFIFKEPKQGFAKLIEDSDLSRNVPITDLLSISMAGHRKQNEATVATKALEALVNKFEKCVGANLWEQVKKCQHSGMSGVFGNTELMTFITAGRIMLSFYAGKDQITFVGDESDYTRTGLQSMNCSVDTATFLVQKVIDNWQNSKLQINDNISIS